MGEGFSVSLGVDAEFSASPEDGRRTPFNDRGGVALLLTFTDFSRGVFLARTGIVLSGEHVGTDLRIRFPTLSGNQYRVDYRTNLHAGDWLVVAHSLAGTGVEMSVTDTNAVLVGERFYRVVRTE